VATHNDRVDTVAVGVYLSSASTDSLMDLRCVDHLTLTTARVWVDGVQDGHARRVELTERPVESLARLSRTVDVRVVNVRRSCARSTAVSRLRSSVALTDQPEAPTLVAHPLYRAVA